MRLLIFTPTWTDPDTGQDRVRPEVRAAIELQVIACPWTWAIGRENPWPIGDYRNVLHQYQRAREMALIPVPSPTGEGRYEALLTIEHDNLLPDTDAVQRLLDSPGDVVYAPYLLRHGQKTLNTWQYINDRNLGMSLSHYRSELRQAREATVHRISGAGFGCTLIRRHVLETIEFTGATDRDQNECPDLRFAEACLRKGFISNGRFDVPVLHYDDASGRWLHPFESRRNPMLKYVARETANAIAAGRRVRLIANAEIELSDEEASDLNSLGLIGPAQPVKTPKKAAPPVEIPADKEPASKVEEVPADEPATPPPSRRSQKKGH